MANEAATDDQFIMKKVPGEELCRHVKHYLSYHMIKEFEVLDFLEESGNALTPWGHPPLCSPLRVLLHERVTEYLPQHCRSACALPGHKASAHAPLCTIKCLHSLACMLPRCWYGDVGTTCCDAQGSMWRAWTAAMGTSQHWSAAG